ncbi:MAG: cytochrome C oxidase subunit I, partial [Proteobacteria bacterium]|nr:cytochrome C oxidase subunit I [Pseudomonadota bacterium]
MSRYWLLMGVSALGIAGLFSLVLVIARTPALADMPLFARLFHEALVVHVDLSVLVWFLAIACLFWSLLAAPSRPLLYGMEQAALICFGLGTLAIAASPLDGDAHALMSNYIPVITSPVFFIGLSLLLCGVLLMLARVFFASNLSDIFPVSYVFGIYTAALITAISAMAFVWSFNRLPPVIEGQQFYELGFWGGGHVLQFTHTQVVMLCWLLLASALRGASVNGKLLTPIFAVGFVCALATPLAYVNVDITSMQHHEFFTGLMIMGGGIAPALLALYLLPVACKRHPQRALRSTLLASLLLFLYGGFLGSLIHGQNVVIPAHYHGSIVGITLAFMGLAYLFLPRFGYADVSNWK